MAAERPEDLCRQEAVGRGRDVAAGGRRQLLHALGDLALDCDALRVQLIETLAEFAKMLRHVENAVNRVIHDMNHCMNMSTPVVNELSRVDRDLVRCVNYMINVVNALFQCIHDTTHCAFSIGSDNDTLLPSRGGAAAALSTAT